MNQINGLIVELVSLGSKVNQNKLNFTQCGGNCYHYVMLKGIVLIVHKKITKTNQTIYRSDTYTLLLVSQKDVFWFV